MKNVIQTALSVCVVLALLALCAVLGFASPSEEQLATLKILLAVCGGSAAYCFIAGEITKNYSQMDKLWSLLPVAYLWIIAVRGGMDARLTVYALIVTAWGARLTFNFARKGAYRLRFWEGAEDYRWAIVRQSPVFRRGFLWTLFDLFFISIYQNLLVLAICLPALAASGSSAPFGISDWLAAALALGFLALETAADAYQWRFYREKKRLLAAAARPEDLPAPYSLGFNTRGPWAYMRHPNYLGEQGMWLSLCLFTVGAGAARAGIFHIAFAGPLLLILLFIGSSALGEKISSGKYPAYADYQRQVCKYLPLRRFSPAGEPAPEPVEADGAD